MTSRVCVFSGRLDPAVNFGKRQNFADQCIEPFDLPIHAVQHGAEFRRALPQDADSGLQAGQRRTQFVGDIMEQPLLRILKLLKPGGAGIEVMSKRGNLVLSAGHLVTDAEVEAAMGERAQAITQMHDGTNEVPGECTCRYRARNQDREPRYEGTNVVEGERRLTGREI